MHLEKKKLGFGMKMLLVVLPVVLAFNIATFIVTAINTDRMMENQAKEQLVSLSGSTGYQIASEIQRIRGLLENVKTSIEKSCSSEEEIQEYLYGVADAYTDIIPTGIYCGLESGVYIDKLWTPDSDWVMKERPWYVEGLKADEVSFGEAYMDSETGGYVVTGYVAIKDSSQKRVGVVCADVQLTAVDEILTDKTFFENGYIYAVDTISGMILSNKRFPEQNGEIVTEQTDAISEYINGAISREDYGEVVSVNGSYVLVDRIPNTNLLLVSVAKEDDVNSQVRSLLLTIAIVSLIGTLMICIIVYFMMRTLLRPVGRVTEMIDRMHNMDLTERSGIRSADEFGDMSFKADQFADKLQDVLRHVKEAISAVDEKADANETAALSLGDLAKEQNDSARDLNSTMSELSGMMTRLSSEAVILDENIAEADDAASYMKDEISVLLTDINEGTGEVSDMSGSMQDISAISERLKNAVENMHEGVEGINSMTQEINAVASQTNLLALNASIEAARAGEAGKGFAVVADEVGALADQTAKSAVNIVKLTKTLEELMTQVSEATDDSIEKIRSGSDAVGRTSETFGSIRDGINKINGSIDRVTSALDGIKDVSGEVIQTAKLQETSTNAAMEECEKLLATAERLSEEENYVEAAGKELKELSLNLGSMVEEFRL